jgi:hypothetical protein
MTEQYLIGELSARLEQLQAVAAQGTVRDVATLRQQIETGTMPGLALAAHRALALADCMCWDSLSRGDVAAFSGLAKIASDLRLFGVSARLLPDWLAQTGGVASKRLVLDAGGGDPWPSTHSSSAMPARHGRG